jgi:hypothetical protein
MDRVLEHIFLTIFWLDYDKMDGSFVSTLCYTPKVPNALEVNWGWKV